jgi:hypothetical protein
MDVQGEVSPWCKQIFLGEEKGCFSPWLIDISWEYVYLLQSTLQKVVFV